MIVVLTGVSGVGKTTVGRLLARELGWPFFDADQFHPPENVAKMSRREPLSDADRQPWLRAIRDKIISLNAAPQSAVITCSALKQQYRNVLTDHGRDAHVRLVHLTGAFELVKQRIDARKDHFMPAALLQSQFETLELPTDALAVDVAGTPEQIVAKIRQQLEA